MTPTVEPDDTLQTLLKKWMLHCVEHQPPTISMQGEWMLCPSCALHYAQQVYILITQVVS